MSYTWTNGEVITAEKLNQTGGGGLVVNVDTDEGTYTPSYESIASAIESGVYTVARRDELFYSLDSIDTDMIAFSRIDISDEVKMNVVLLMADGSARVSSRVYPSGT